MTRTGTYILWQIGRCLAPERRAWRGEMPLAAVFWGYGVAASGELIILHALALYLQHQPLQQALIILSTLYTAWVLMAIWRCSAAATLFWGTMARWLTIAWGLNVAFVLFFLQLDLLVRYAKG